MAYPAAARPYLESESEELFLDEFLVDLPADPPAPPSAAAPRPRSRWSLPQAGDLFASRYVLEEVLGRNGSECVCLAWDAQTQTRVVLRYLVAVADLSPAETRAFTLAAHKAKALNSRFAEQIVDVGALPGGAPYRVTLLPAGPSLYDVLQVRGSVDMAEAVDLLLTACHALAEAHAAGLSYGTLCTKSLFVTGVEGHSSLRFVDLAVAEPLARASLSGRELTVPGLCATALPYTAPEQIRSPASVDHRVDVWSLGAILYELLAGVRPFDSSNPLALLAAICADDPTPLELRRRQVPETLARIVHACLQKEAWLRPQSMSDLISLLMPFASARTRTLVCRPSLVAAGSAATLIGHPAPSVEQRGAVHLATALEPQRPPRSPARAQRPSAPTRRASVSARTPTAYGLVLPSFTHTEGSSAEDVAARSSPAAPALHRRHFPDTETSPTLHTAVRHAAGGTRQEPSPTQPWFPKQTWLLLTSALFAGGLSAAVTAYGVRETTPSSPAVTTPATPSTLQSVHFSNAPHSGQRLGAEARPVPAGQSNSSQRAVTVGTSPQRAEVASRSAPAPQPQPALVAAEANSHRIGAPAPSALLGEHLFEGVE